MLTIPRALFASQAQTYHAKEFTAAEQNPSRLRGISAYREIEREFAAGDRLQ